jgi:hypothetical protein
VRSSSSLTSASVGDWTSSCPFRDWGSREVDALSSVSFLLLLGRIHSGLAGQLTSVERTVSARSRRLGADGRSLCW